MKIISIDPQKRKVVAEPQTAEDLWRLSGVIEAGDAVSGRTERKVKINEDTVVRKPMTLSLDVEKTELQGDTLRISGTVREGNDDVPKGAYHTISLAVHETVTIEKEWLGWQLDKLREQDGEIVLMLLMDREEAVFAQLRREPEVLTTVKGTVQKKGYEGGNPYWNDLVKMLQEYDARLKPRHIVIASPAFFKEYVVQLLPAELMKKTVTATISATGESAMAELIRRPELKSVLAQERYAQEILLVEELMKAIREDKAAWGLDDVEQQVNTGALGSVLVTTSYLSSTRSEGNYDRLIAVMKLAESMKAQVHVLDTSAAHQVDRLGGVAGVKRW